MAKEKHQTKEHPAKKDESKPKIAKDMLIGEIIRIKPEAAMVMMEFGLHCIGCHVSTMESLEQGSLAHGLSEEEIDKMVEKINSM